MARVPINPRAALTGTDGSPTRYGMEYLTANETVVDDEAAARIAADNALQADINAEASTRALADVALQQAVDDEESARIAADAALQSQINAFPGFLTATLSINFPSVAAQGQRERTITVTGAALGDAVFLGPPDTFDAGLVATGYVSAADTVTVRVANVTAGAIDPAVATWRATVVRP